MLIQEAQREMREVYVGGAVGTLVSGVLWLVSAALGTWVSAQAGLLSLFFGGMLIFPLTQLALKLAGRAAVTRRENALNGLARQVAFIVPLCIPVIYGAALYNINWYYPAFLIVVGAHYLPFIFLYGQPLFGVLAGLMLGGGVALIWLLPGVFSAGGWLGGLLLVVFAALLWRSSRKAG